MSRDQTEKQYKSRGPAPRPNGLGNRVPGSYIGLSPTKEQKGIIVQWEETNRNDILSNLSRIAESGYKISVKWHIGAAAFQASATGVVEGEFNYERTMAAYHIDLERSLSTLVWSLLYLYPYTDEWASAQLSFDNKW